MIPEARIYLNIGANEVLEMTITEVMKLFNVYEDKITADMQEKAYFTYILGDLIGISVGRLFSEKAEYPDICDVFPALFDNEEDKELIEQARRDAEVAKIKDQWFKLAEVNNKKYKNKKAGDTK